MRAKTSVSGLFLAILAGVSAAALLPAAPASAEAPKSCLSILAPASEAVVAPGKVLVIGSARGEGLSRVEIDVNGKGKRTVDVSGGGFSTVLDLSRGRNVIRVTAGKSGTSVVVMVESKGAYRYHPEVEKCGSCHDRPGGGYAVAGPLQSICYRCHDRLDTGRNVHGPLGGGECTACHDPHGSGNASLALARHETLCVTCHDQESSAEHFRRSQNRQCTTCHAAHSSDKPFLQK